MADDDEASTSDVKRVDIKKLTLPKTCLLDAPDIMDVIRHDYNTCGKCRVERELEAAKKTGAFKPEVHVPSVRARKEAEEKRLLEEKLAKEEAQRRKREQKKKEKEQLIQEKIEERKQAAAEKHVNNDVPFWKLKRDKIKALRTLYGLNKKEAEQRFFREQQLEKQAAKKQQALEDAAAQAAAVDDNTIDEQSLKSAAENSTAESEPKSSQADAPTGAAGTKRKRAPSPPKEKTLVDPSLLPWAPAANFHYFNHRSSLSFYEHRRLIAMMLNVTNHGALKFVDQRNEYDELRGRQLAEAQTFSDVVCRIVCKERGDKPSILRSRREHPLRNALAFYRTRQCAKASRLLRGLDASEGSYVEQSAFDAIAGPATISLVKDACLREQTDRPRVQLPDLKHKTLLTDDAELVQQLCPPNENKIPVAADAVMSELAERHGQSVLLSGSALSLLLLLWSPSHHHRWMLPLTVKYQFVNGQPCNLLCFDSPLPPLHSTAAQQFYCYLKHALKARLFHPTKAAGKDKQQQPQDNAAESTGEKEPTVKTEPDTVTAAAEQNEEEQTAASETSDNADAAQSQSEVKQEPEADAEQDMVDTASAAAAAVSSENEPRQTDTDSEAEGQLTIDVGLGSPPPDKRARRDPSPVAAAARKRPGDKSKKSERRILTEIKSEPVEPSEAAAERPVQRKGGGGVDLLDSILSGMDQTLTTPAAPSTATATQPKSPRTAKASSSSSTSIVKSEPKTESSASASDTTTADASGSGDSNAMLDILSKLEQHSDTNVKVKRPVVEDEEDEAADVKPETTAGSRDRHSYVVWTVRDQLQGGDEAEPQRLLVRAGYLGQANQHTNVSALPAVEYVPEHGAMHLTPVQYLHHYVHFLLSGADEHRIMHVHAHQLHLLGCRAFNATTWTRLFNARHQLQQRLSQGIARLHHLLDVLKKEVTAGEYLLCRDDEWDMRRQDGDDSVRLRLLRMQSGDTASVSLQDAYGRSELQMFGIKLDMPDSSGHHNSNYFPGIDPDVLLCWHKLKSRVPATFFPRDEHMPPYPANNGSKFNGALLQQQSNKPAGYQPEFSIGFPKAKNNNNNNNNNNKNRKTRRGTRANRSKKQKPTNAAEGEADMADGGDE